MLFICSVKTSSWTITGDTKDCSYYKPTDLNYTGVTELVENSTTPKELGILSATDAIDYPFDKTKTYSLTCETNGANDSMFAISGDKLILAASPDYEATQTQMKSVCAYPTLTITIDTTPPDAPVITQQPVTPDNIINFVESQGNITLTGTVTGANNGNTIYLTINNNRYTANIEDGRCSVTVLGSNLVSDLDKNQHTQVICP